jgi:ribonuclease T1
MAERGTGTWPTAWIRGHRPRLMHRLPVVLLLAWLLAGCAAVPGSASTSQALDPVDGLPVVQMGDLPPEAAATLALIETEGPFPYRQDGAVFQNREGLLPQRPAGHYREYTVETPGSDDRGARRIVTGADGERYYTDDHYDSFRWIAP